MKKENKTKLNKKNWVNWRNLIMRINLLILNYTNEKKMWRFRAITTTFEGERERQRDPSWKFNIKQIKSDLILHIQTQAPTWSFVYYIEYVIFVTVEFILHTLKLINSRGLQKEKKKETRRENQWIKKMSNDK